MEYAALNNGVKIPMLGYGVFQIPAEDTKRCVLNATLLVTAASTRHRAISMRKV